MLQPTVLPSSRDSIGTQAAPFWRLAVEIERGGRWTAVAGSDTQATPVGEAGSAWQQDGSDIFDLSGIDVPAGARVRVTVTVPLLNYARVIIPDCGRHYVNTMKALDIRAGLFRVIAPNAGHPFFALVDEGGDFLFSFGLLDAPGEVHVKRVLPSISQRKAMIGGDEHLALAFEWQPNAGLPGKRDHACFLTTDQHTWFTALRRYTDLIRRRESIEIPTHPAAWDAVWCTWTAFPSATMTTKRVLENARIARDLGIRTIILDDGWFGAGLDDDHGVINHGDYLADLSKFQDLPGMFDDIRAMGLKCLLWHAPLCVAPTSNCYPRTKHWHMHGPDGEFLSVNGLAQLCPACPDVRAYVAEEVTRLMHQFRPDGFKIDLYNCLPDFRCQSKQHTHDIDDPVQAVDAVMKVVWDAARAVKPDVLVELKQDYGNVRLIRHGTMVRAGDTAYDMDTNCQRCAYTQAFSPCVHVDPIVTSIYTDPKRTPLLMIKALALGVPTFSMDLPQFGEAHRAAIRNYLSIYNEHRTMFEQPRRPQSNDTMTWTGGDERKAWVAAIRDARTIELPDSDVVTVFNGTGAERLWVTASPRGNATVEVFDAVGNPEPVAGLRLDLSSDPSLRIPSGGRAELRFL